MRNIVLVGLTLLLTCAPAFSQEEPSYAGKPLAHWLKAVKDKSVDTRVEAIEALQSIGAKGKGVIEALSDALKDEDADVRTFALASIGDIGQATKEGATVIADLASRSKDPATRALAMATLVKIKASKEVTPLLKKMLNDPDPETAFQALALLVKVEPGMSNELLETFREGKARPIVLDAIPHELLRLEPRPKDLVPTLIAELKNKNRAVREAAAHALASVLEASQPVAEVLLPLLKADDPQVRTAVAGSLSAVAMKTDNAELRRRIGIETAHASLREKDYWRSQRLASISEWLHPKEQSDVLASFRSPADQERFARKFCGRGDIPKGFKDPENTTRPGVGRGLEREDWMERIDAFWTLTDIGLANKEAAEVYVAAAIKEPEPVVRRLAFAFLREAEENPVLAVRPLLAAHQRSTGEIRMLIEATLKKVDPKAAAGANIK